jgi:hypothetical protein
MNIPKENRDWDAVQSEFDAASTIVMADSTSLATDNRVHLNVFGNVTNTTSEDWSNISISLVPSEVSLLSSSSSSNPVAKSKAMAEMKKANYSSGGNLFVKTLTGKTVTLDVEFSDEAAAVRFVDLC